MEPNELELLSRAIRRESKDAMIDNLKLYSDVKRLERIKNGPIFFQIDEKSTRFEASHRGLTEYLHVQEEKMLVNHHPSPLPYIPQFCAPI